MDDSVDISVSLTNYIKQRDTDIYLFSAAISTTSADIFVNTVHQKSTKRPTASVFLTTFGGDPDAAYRIAKVLRREYKSVRVLIAGVCKSAGTLVALAADELAFSEFGEIGPLDTQISKPDELLLRHSGLDILQSMNSITQSTFECFEDHMLRIVRASSGAISTKVAADISIQLASGIMAPISAQIDPVRLGSAHRAIDIARAYGMRLSRLSRNLKQGSLDQLIEGYPAHGFVIDVDEAKELFNAVSQFDSAEDEVFRAFRNILRVQGEELIVDLEQVFGVGDSTDEDDEEAGTSDEPTASTGSAKGGSSRGEARSRRNSAHRLESNAAAPIRPHSANGQAETTAGSANA